MRDRDGGAPWRAILSAAAMLVVGLYVVVLSLVGLWTYVQRGYAVSRGGERIDALWGPWYYAALILGGLLLIGVAVARYRRDISGGPDE